MLRSACCSLAALLLPGLTVLSGGGCASTSTSAGGMSEAITEYREEDYASARSEAAQVARSGPADDRDEADYVAGLAAYRLGDLDDAEAHLMRATASDDPLTCGYAQAQLGFVHLHEHRPWRAANSFTSASETLEGADAARAARWASHAFEQANDHAAARRWLDRARELSPGSGSSSSGRSGHSGTSSGAFALQVGAFRERNRAERAASDARPLARTAGLGNVRINERPDVRVGKLYVVQFGDFETRREANRARNLVGRLDYIVSAAD